MADHRVLVRVTSENLLDPGEGPLLRVVGPKRLAARHVDLLIGDQVAWNQLPQSEHGSAVGLEIGSGLNLAHELQRLPQLVGRQFCQLEVRRTTEPAEDSQFSPYRTEVSRITVGTAVAIRSPSRSS